MTKSLTEQWKAGILDEGCYYMKTKYDKKVDAYENFGGIRGYDTDDIKEVLAPVPSYDHFSQLVKKVKKVKKLERQLAIAKKALKKMAKDNFQCAEQTLEEIELRR